MNITYDRHKHDACNTYYNVAAGRPDHLDTFRVKLWIIVGGIPALDYDHEGYHNTRRYPVHPLYANDRPWLGYYPHQILNVPGNPYSGVVDGPGIETLPNGEADFLAYIEETYAEFCVARQRRRELRELLGHGYWGILKSGRTLVHHHEEDPGRYRMRMRFNLHAYVYKPEPYIDGSTNDAYVDTEEHLRIIKAFPAEWQTLYDVIQAGIVDYKGHGHEYGPRWWELREVHYNRIMAALKDVVALGRTV